MGFTWRMVRAELWRTRTLFALFALFAVWVELFTYVMPMLEVLRPQHFVTPLF